MAAVKPLATIGTWEYWKQGDDIYRTAVGNRGPVTASGVPQNARWECSVTHFERFKSMLENESAKDEGISPEQMKEIRKVQALASCPFTVAAACYTASGGNLEKAIQSAKKQWPNSPFGNAKDTMKLSKATLDRVFRRGATKDGGPGSGPKGGQPGFGHGAKTAQGKETAKYFAAQVKAGKNVDPRIKHEFGIKDRAKDMKFSRKALDRMFGRGDTKAA